MKRTKTIYSLVILLQLFLMPLVADSQSVNNRVLQAAREYNQKQYAQAITLYNSILSEGLESAALYYNLGNAYYRSKNTTMAIYCYEKALKLSPGDPDIIHNLQVANSRIIDKIDQVPEIFYVRWWHSFMDVFSESGLAIWLVVLLSLALICGVLYIVFSKPSWRTAAAWTGIILLAIMVVFWMAASGKKHQLTHEHEAIVFSPTVDVKSSPDDASTVLFVIHEGAKVKLLDKVGDWQEIKIANGSQGWMKSSDMKVI